jgi:hypothetical protein
MTLIHHSDVGFDADSVVGWEVDAGNLKIFLRGKDNPLVVPAANGKGLAFLDYLQKKGTLVKQPAPPPRPGG